MKKVYIETHGCQMNVSDSERLATVLETNNFELTSDEESADVFLFNTCSVREKAEHKLYTRVGEIRQRKGEDSIIGVTGCVAQLEGENLLRNTNKIDFVLGTKATGRISEIINRSITEGDSVFDLGSREEDYDWAFSEKSSHSKHVAFLPIIEGCNKFCTYCIVPFSRGREKSLDFEYIIRRAKGLMDQGFKEVHLIGQNVNSYRPASSPAISKFAGATPFSKLLRAVAATGFGRIKFTTSFPRDFHPDIIKAINENENLCNWVHLPVQSGSDKILKVMRRGHTAENYLRRIDVIHNSERKIGLTTDVIVGFPGETDEDFDQTVKLFEYSKFHSAYIFKYSKRKGTPAAELSNEIPQSVVTERFLHLEKIQKQIQQKIWSEYVGRKVSVLIENLSAKNSKQLTGHSTCHKVVNFEGSADLIGTIAEVEITESKNNSLFGKLV